jgi:anti-sigma factor RsiW
MATNRDSSDVIERLNALIDGELPPAEHAALAARIAVDRELAYAYATLARLKACVAERAELAPSVAIALPKARRRVRPTLGLAAAAAVAAIAAVAVFAVGWEPEPRRAPTSEIAPLIRLAALPASPIIPDLADAGLNLVGGELERVGKTAVLVAIYRGPRGCRLELRVRPSVADVEHTVGTSRRSWTVGDLAYELVAFGMPAKRFAAVADALETATGVGRLPPMREASRSGGPCVG